MKKYKILALVQLPPPLHGAAVINKASIKCLRECGCVAVDCFDIKLANSISDVNKFNLTKVYLYVKLVFCLMFKLIANRYDAAYFSISPTGISFLKDSIFGILLRIFRVKRIYHIHGNGVASYSDMYVYRLLYMACMSGADIFVLSETLKKEYSVFDFEYKMHILSNFVAKPLRDPLEINRKRLSSVKGGKKRVLFLSNLRKGKGVLVVAELIKMVMEQERNVEIILAGPWSSEKDKDEFDRLIGGIDNAISHGVLRCCGYVDGDIKEKLFIESDIFLFPSFIDTFPLVVLEALSYGLPVIASDQGGVPDILSGNNGIIIDKFNLQLFVDSVINLLNDDERLSVLSKNARRCYEEKYTPSTYEKEFMLTIMSILNRSD